MDGGNYTNQLDFNNKTINSYHFQQVIKKQTLSRAKFLL